MVSEARRLSIKNYRQEKRDQIAVDVPKGKREEYKQKAAKLGLSLSMLIQYGVESYGEEYISNHAGEVMTPQPKPEPLSAADKQLVEEFARLPADAQKHFLKAFKAINQNVPQ